MKNLKEEKQVIVVQLYYFEGLFGKENCRNIRINGNNTVQHSINECNVML